MRCSQCKTAFIVKKPGATPSDVVDEVIAEVAGPGHSSAPEPSEDLFERSQPEIGSAHANATGDEDHWEFNEAAEPTPELGVAAAPQSAQRSQPPPRADTEEDLDSLGSPEGWDLLSGAAERIAQEASFQEDSAPRSAPPTTPVERAKPARVESPPAAIPAAAHVAVETPTDAPAWRDFLESAAQTAVLGAAWIAAASLCGGGLAIALAPRAFPAATPHVRTFDAPRGVSELAVRSIESAVAGRLTVVRGEIAPGAAHTRLRVKWLDSEGRALATGLAGPPLAGTQLRELGLARIHAEHALRSESLAHGGAFEVAFAELPEGAVGIAVTRERTPQPAPPPAPATSSDPAALPSSE